MIWISAWSVRRNGGPSAVGPVQTRFTSCWVRSAWLVWAVAMSATERLWGLRVGVLVCQVREQLLNQGADGRLWDGGEQGVTGVLGLLPVQPAQPLGQRFDQRCGC